MIKSTSYNVRPDKHTLDQINKLAPDKGVIVFDTDNNVNRYHNGVEWKIFPEGSSPSDDVLDNRIIVNQNNFATTLGGVIDSSKEYFIDGVINIGDTQITVPVGGMTMRGYSFDISGLISTTNSHTMFISESIAIGSGNLLASDMYFMTMGAGSKLMELYAASGGSGQAIEFSKVNFVNCTSLGDAYDYRQWLESNTGRFSGAPSMTFHGLWTGGAKITDQITRGVAGTFSGALYQEGTLFQMNNRFYAEVNVDLGTLSSLVDFQPSNFPNAETLQLHDCIVTRDGAYDDTDPNLTPNVTATDACSNWEGNVGLPNTFVDNFTKIIKSTTAPTDTSVLWLEDELDHVSLYSYDDRISNWVGTERQYEFITAHTITAGHDFEVGASEYRIPVTHDAIPVKVQIIMETASTGALAIGGVSSGLIGDFILDGSSRSLQGAVDNPDVISKGDDLYISLAGGSQDVTNSVIILTMKNVG